MRILTCIVLLCSAGSVSAQNGKLCLDGLCIGESINDPHFAQVNWIVPNKELTKEACVRVTCKPEVAFRGYPAETQKQLSETLSWVYGSIYPYNVVTKANIEVLRQYKYECSNSERHFMAAYFSDPSHYLTIVGLRLMGGELRIYRIVRQYPYRNQNELVALAKKLHDEHGNRIVFYDGISSNAYSDVIVQRKAGWFGRSSVFNPLDPSDNAAEFVLIDPNTRPLLQPMSIPGSGDISQLSVDMPEQCSRSLPLQ
jgi:hypothetical protein